MESVIPHRLAPIRKESNEDGEVESTNITTVEEDDQ